MRSRVFRAPPFLRPMRRSAGARPTHITLTVGFGPWQGANFTSPPTVGTPIEFPYCPIPATTPENRYRFRSTSRGPNRSGSSRATGRAPMESTSRTIPPTPVAAPWNGSMALGWECDSILNTQATPSPRSTTPASCPGPTST